MFSKHFIYFVLIVTAATLFCGCADLLEEKVRANDTFVHLLVKEPSSDPIMTRHYSNIATTSIKYNAFLISWHESQGHLIDTSAIIETILIADKRGELFDCTDDGYKDFVSIIDTIVIDKSLSGLVVLLEDSFKYSPRCVFLCVEYIFKNNLYNTLPEGKYKIW